MADPSSFRNRIRVGGMFTIFSFGGQPIAFCQQVAHTSPQPVGQGASAIHPMDEPYPVEIITPAAAGMGQLTLNLFELWGQGDASKVWDRLGSTLSNPNGQGVGPFGSTDSFNSSTNLVIGGSNTTDGVFNGAVDIVDVFIRQAQANPTQLNITKIIRPLPTTAGASAPPYTEEYHGCFAGEERYLTKQGPRTFADSVGETVEALTTRGFVDSEVKYLGEQPLNKITLKPVTQMKHWRGGDMWKKSSKGDFKLEIEATPNHRWVKEDGTITDDLSVRDLLASMHREPDTSCERYRDGLRHGLVFGDGTLEYQRKTGERLFRHALRLYGAKAIAQKHLFEDVRIEESLMPPTTKGAGYGGTAIVYATQSLKELPETTDPDYLAGFVEGWIIADAHHFDSGLIRLDSINHEALDWVEERAPLAGYLVIGKGESLNEETNYAKRSRRIRNLSLRKDNVLWRVEAIEDTERVAPVYCLDVPDEHAFTLASGLYTGNCIITNVIDGEQIEIGTMEIIKQITVAYRFLTRNGKSSAGFALRDAAL